jgi:hypothetical protein
VVQTPGVTFCATQSAMSFICSPTGCESCACSGSYAKIERQRVQIASGLTLSSRLSRPAEESHRQALGSQRAGNARSEWHHDTAGPGRLPIVDRANRGFCYRPQFAGPAEPRSFDHMPNDTARGPAASGQWLVRAPGRVATMFNKQLNSRVNTMEESE